MAWSNPDSVSCDSLVEFDETAVTDPAQLAASERAYRRAATRQRLRRLVLPALLVSAGILIGGLAVWLLLRS